MGTYVLDLGCIAFDNWWSVGLALSAIISYALFNFIPFVYMSARSIFGKYPNLDDPIAASCALLPLLGMIVGLIFWDKVKPMLYVGAFLITAMALCAIGSLLCVSGII